ncbi:DUF302 domain-containing protein [Streptomyces sp. NPDC088354]|uniref:DUF302 domain-containing protein n=1 Tax=unclassified Streptomyces TaxID=2593676 RepID=UPI0029B6B3D6|nr:DUF302 domain-containing protein [Streptomyces sp. MI02-7b]MDX3077042.1 DUF302 domain-containing protein [Streptomyces sp. MI02-7b]
MPSESHVVKRVEVHTGVPYAEFITALEKAAPPLDATVYELIEEAGGTWDDVREAMAVNAPHDLIRYGRISGTQVMKLTGGSTKSMEYLIGNHVIAERMFRHDPRALLYAPLRMLVWSDENGDAVFATHRPSDEFGSLGNAEVTEVGEELDRHVIELLRLCGVDAEQDFA